ncbi:MAG TPA: ATP-binding protein [Acidimicrobiales bacterium]|nr:ATP-binding protein [Acidimicrobiales bacterium]
MIDRLADGVLVADSGMTIVDVNATLAGMLGQTKDALVGQPVRVVFADGVELATGDDGVLTEQEVELNVGDGERSLARVTGRVDDEGMILSFRSDKSTAGIEIVSTVSHELRSPLTSVKGYTSLLLNRWDRLADDQKKMMLEQVHHDADRVTRLITELLDISRLETGRLVLRREMVDLSALTKAIVDKVGMEYADLDVTIHFADDVPNVYADPDKLEQVITNLVENACKYASPRGIALTADLDAARDEVVVSVTDVGEGIPHDALPKVFTKFFRRNEGRPTGSGLGLWISRGLVEAHGGHLTASSALGKGSTFRFTLPTNAFEDIHGTDDG